MNGSNSCIEYAPLKNNKTRIVSVVFCAWGNDNRLGFALRSTRKWKFLQLLYAKQLLLLWFHKMLPLWSDKSPHLFIRRKMQMLKENNENKRRKAIIVCKSTLTRYLLLHRKALAGVVRSNLSLIKGGAVHLAMPGSTYAFFTWSKYLHRYESYNLIRKLKEKIVVNLKPTFLLLILNKLLVLLSE